MLQLGKNSLAPSAQLTVACLLLNKPSRNRCKIQTLQNQLLDSVWQPLKMATRRARHETNPLWMQLLVRSEPWGPPQLPQLLHTCPLRPLLTL